VAVFNFLMLLDDRDELDEEDYRINIVVYCFFHLFQATFYFCPFSHVGSVKTVHYKISFSYAACLRDVEVYSNLSKERFEKSTQRLSLHSVIAEYYCPY